MISDIYCITRPEKNRPGAAAGITPQRSVTCRELLIFFIPVKNFYPDSEEFGD
jgi:hypothetical protein